MSVRLWNFKDGGSSNASFLPKYRHEIVVFWEYGEQQFIKKCWYRTFKVNFLCQISTEFRKKKHFFLTSIFEPLYFLKSCPSFDKLALPVFTKYNGFLWVYWSLAKILAFEDPPSLKFHKPTDIITNPLFYEKTIKQTNYFLHQVHMPVQNSCWFIICENLARLTFYFKNLPPIFEVTRYILKKSWNQNVHIFTLFTEKEKQRKC